MDYIRISPGFEFARKQLELFITTITALFPEQAAIISEPLTKIISNIIENPESQERDMYALGVFYQIFQGVVVIVHGG